MDVKELKEAKNKLESDIKLYIDLAVLTFILKNGVEVESVHVSIDRVATFSKEKPEFMYSRVDVTLDI
jgi:hypothetical protein